MRRFLEFSAITFALLGLSLPLSAQTATVSAQVPADGVTDATAAIQQQLDAVAITGGQVVLLPGQYLIQGSLKVPSAVTLRGSWTAPHHGSEWKKGTTLLITGGRDNENGPAAIQLSPDAAVEGLTLLWPEETWNDIRPYPWAIRGLGQHITVQNVTLVNAYQGIDVGEDGSLHLIRNVYGLALRRGIMVDRTTDIGRIENVHFNPHYWLRSGHPSSHAAAPGSAGPQGKPFDAVEKFLTENLDAFIFARSDWEYVVDTFVWGANHGYLFIKSDKGACNGQFLGIGADFCRTCVQIDSIQEVGLQITNGEFTAFAGDPNSAIVTAPGAGGAAQFVNCNFWGVRDHAAWLQGDTQVTLADCHICPGGGDVLADRGRLIVQGCNFEKSGKTSVILHPDVKAAILMGNLQPDGFKVDNEIGAHAQIGLNETP
jgi:hypothetical protein